jgi:hypothetical protein
MFIVRPWKKMIMPKQGKIEDPNIVDVALLKTISGRVLI